MSADGACTFRARLFEWEGEGAWHFVRLPDDAADEIRLRGGPPRGFGSVRVRVRIGGTEWRTSVFPDQASGSYLLPVKRQVRVAERLAAGDEARFELAVEEEGPS